jgi:UDP-GlcNAc:undecaprenyl-phosphate GlcNAc-1-phosphate transferase
MTIIVTAFLITLGVALVLTPMVRAFARHVGFTDKPDKERKLHRQATALGGGVAIFLATITGMGIVLLVPSRWQSELFHSWPELFALLMASGTIVAVGLLDDHYRLRGSHKLLGQVLATLILVGCGLTVKQIEILGWQVQLGPLSGIVTVVWLLGAINAINLLDGIDGLASTIGLILTAAIATMAAMYGNWTVSIVALMFAAGQLGFLRYNFPPATIFLGDAGSMLIGLVLGTLAIQGSLKSAGTVLIAAPLAFWTIPLLDSAAAIVRRSLTGRSIYDTDRAHLHHRLMRSLGSNRKVVAGVAACCGLTAAAALAGVMLRSDSVAVISCLVVIGLLVATRLFGYVEFSLIWASLSELYHHILRRPIGKSETARDNTVRLQGHREWERVWESLTEQAERLGLVRMRLVLNMAVLEEGFYATWHGHVPSNCPQRWRVELPLFARGQSVGRLLVVGQPGSEGAFRELEVAMAVLAPLEDMLNDIASDQHLQPVVPQTILPARATVKAVSRPESMATAFNYLTHQDAAAADPDGFAAS